MSVLYQKLCSGFGQYHSPTAKKHPKPLQTIDWAKINEMLESPPSVAKDQAQWFIPSTLLSRDHSEQRNNGVFWCLWADIDETQGITFADLVEIVGRCFVDDFLAYTSRSATEDNQKARLLIPLSEHVDGETYIALQRILNNKLEASGIRPDRATERAGQLCYLPNRGEFYDYHKEALFGPMSPDNWADDLAAERETLAQDAKELATRRAKALAKAKERAEAGTHSPIEAYNASFPLDLVFAQYSYQKRGKRWLSPNSSSGTAGVVVQPSGRWVSAHESDCDIGRPCDGGTVGDAFDLFCYYEHSGDRDAALKAAGEMFTVDGVSLTKANQRQYMSEQQALETAAEFENETSKDPDANQAVDLFNALELPPFPLQLLPKAIADYAKDQAELIGVDPAVIAMAAIGAAAACIDDRLQIQPKRHDTGWREQARLWVGIIGDPSAKKSPGISKAMGPLFNIDKHWREETSKAMAEWLEACEGIPKGEEKPPEPIGKRLILNDATVEKMGDILSKSEPRGILSYQDELSGWLASMDAYKNGAGGKDKAAWLEAYNGGHKAIDRVGRGSTFVENWSACVLGGIQPSVVQSYAHTTNHDGMLQRFVLVQASESRLGADRRPDTEARERYSRLMEGLAALVVDGSPVVTLSDEAHRAREALDEKLHRITRSHPNKYLTAALGKWNGLYARLLLVFHCIDCVNAGEYPTFCEVSGRTAQNTADLLWRTLLPHAIKFYNGLDPTEDDARTLAALILARGWERFTVKRDLNRYWKASRKLKPWELEETLDRLEAFSWIYPEAGHVNEKGKPSAYLVNPGVHKRFAAHAENERERRKEVAAMMAELSA